MSQITIKYYIMKTLWDQLSKETKAKLTVADLDMKAHYGWMQPTNYWQSRLSNINNPLDLRIDQWRHLKNDLGLGTIEEAYWKVLEEVNENK